MTSDASDDKRFNALFRTSGTCAYSAGWSFAFELDFYNVSPIFLFRASKNADQIFFIGQ